MKKLTDFKPTELIKEIVNMDYFKRCLINDYTEDQIYDQGIDTACFNKVTDRLGIELYSGSNDELAEIYYNLEDELTELIREEILSRGSHV